MTTLDQAKAMAKRLRSSLATRDIDMSHSTALELIAAELGSGPIKFLAHA